MLLAGCATTVSPKKFSQLQIGMSKDEVRQVLGEPHQFKFKSAGNNQETWEYLVYAPYTTVLGYEEYWVTFINDKLYLYGRPIDYGPSTYTPETKTEESQKSYSRSFTEPLIESAENSVQILRDMQEDLKEQQQKREDDYYQDKSLEYQRRQAEALEKQNKSGYGY